MQTPGISELFRERNAEVPHLPSPGRYQDAPGVVGSLPRSENVESQLIEQAKLGDRAAMNKLLARIRNRAMAVALKHLKNPEDAQDALQEAYVKIWKNLKTFEGRSSFATWVHRIVTNASLDLLRQISSRAERSDTRSENEAPEQAPERVEEATPESLLAAREVSVRVRGAVRALPTVYRQTLELREFEDLAYDEVACQLRCPVGTVMSRLHHARKQLADQIQQSDDGWFGYAAA